MWEKVLELFQKYGLAGFFFAIAIHYFVQFTETNEGLLSVIAFALIGSACTFFSDLSKAILKPVTEKLGESISDTLIRWLELGWISISSKFQRDYYKALQFTFSDYRIQGFNIGNRVPDLEQMFIPLGVTTPEIEDIAAGLIQAEEEGERYTIWDFLVDGIEQPLLRHQALLAPPGSGKTTLLKHLILAYVKNTHRRHHRKAPKLIPFFIALRDIDTVVARSRPSLPRLIERLDLIKRCHPPETWIENRLKQGQCLIMLDGLDEIADIETRQQVSEWMNNQITLYRDNYFIITSRPLGYRSVRLQAIRRTLKVEPFTLGQIEQFIHSWYVQHELLRRPKSGSSASRISRRQAKRTAHTKATDLFDRIKDSPPLAAMALNPLLLTMMTSVHNYRAVLPENRVRLYAEIYKVLIEQRQIDRDNYDEAIAQQTQALLQALALAMMEHNTQEYRLKDDNLSLSSTIEQIIGSDKSLETFLEHTDSAHGLLVKKTEGTYEFSHESFQSYLAAVQMQALGKESELLEHVPDIWWFDTLYLYAAAQRDATKIVQVALNHSTVESLNLAYTLDQDGVFIEPEMVNTLRQKIDEGLLSDDPEIFKLAAEVKLSNRLRRLLRLSDTTEIDQHHLSCAEYQLFLEESQTPAYPEHWTSDRFLPDQAQQPVVGLRAEDAQAFCDWLTQKKAKPDLRFRYRLPRLAEVRGHPSQEAGTGCWCDDLKDRRVAGLRPTDWQRWQSQLSERLRECVEGDRPYLQALTQTPDFIFSLDLESDTGVQLVFDPSMDLTVALRRLLALDVSRALGLARGRPITALLTDDDLKTTIQTCDRTLTRRETRSFKRDRLLNRRAHSRDFQPVRGYLLLIAELWQALADAHASLAEDRQQQRVLRFFPRVIRQVLTYPLNRIRRDCINHRNRVMNLYAFFALIETRKEGHMAAWEGIRIVKETVSRPSKI